MRKGTSDSRLDALTQADRDRLKMGTTIALFDEFKQRFMYWVSALPDVANLRSEGQQLMNDLWKLEIQLNGANARAEHLNRRDNRETRKYTKAVKPGPSFQHGKYPLDSGTGRDDSRPESRAAGAQSGGNGRSDQELAPDGKPY